MPSGRVVIYSLFGVPSSILNYVVIGAASEWENEKVRYVGLKTKFYFCDAVVPHWRGVRLYCVDFHNSSMDRAGVSEPKET